MEPENGHVETPNITENQSPEVENQEIPVEEPVVENKQADTKDAEIAHFKDAFLRIMAEFENYKKRTSKEKSDLIKFASQELMAALLPTLDDFGRALATIEKADNLSAVRDGIQMITDNFYKVLQKQGLEPMNAKGLPFDSNFHEAIASMPVEDEAMKGKVIEEVEKGYMMKDKVIRFARVIVGE